MRAEAATGAGGGGLTAHRLAGVRLQVQKWPPGVDGGDAEAAAGAIKTNQAIIPAQDIHKCCPSRWERTSGTRLPHWSCSRG